MKLQDKFKIIENHHQRLVARNEALTTAIAQLTAYGCINAKEYWKDGKYLYLLYAMKDGVRKKKYVGNHPLRIKEARKKLQNYEDRNSLILTQETVQEDIRRLDQFTNQMLRICSKSDLSAKFVCQDENTGDNFFCDSCGSHEGLYPNQLNHFGYRN